MLKDLSRKEKIEIGITTAGVIFLVFLVLGNIQKIHEKERSLNKTDKAVISSLSVPVSFEADRAERPDMNEGWGRDPFSLDRSGMTDSGIEGLVLNGIVWDNDNPYAIVNSDIVKTGDKLGSMLVVEINETNIIIEDRNGGRYTLELNVF